MFYKGQVKAENKIVTEVKNCPTFKNWKGEIANEMLQEFCEVSNNDKDFILTMGAENGSFNPYLKHPIRNKNGTWDYANGLNSAYHMPMIKKIMAKQVSMNEIAQYHYNIYQKRKGAFYGYSKRNNSLKLLNI